MPKSNGSNPDYLYFHKQGVRSGILTTHVKPSSTRFQPVKCSTIQMMSVSIYVRNKSPLTNKRKKEKCL